MENKSRFITPGIMLFAGAISMIIMIWRKYELYRMLWTLLVVLVVFYIIGDIARYIYSTIRPRIIPASLDLENLTKQVEERIGANHGIAYLDESSAVGETLGDTDVSSGSENTEEEVSYLEDAFEEEYSDESLSES